MTWNLNKLIIIIIIIIIIVIVIVIVIIINKDGPRQNFIHLAFIDKLKHTIIWEAEPV